MRKSSTVGVPSGIGDLGGYDFIEEVTVRSM